MRSPTGSSSIRCRARGTSPRSCARRSRAARRAPGATRPRSAVSVAQLVATTPAELEAVRTRVAFYGSTPGYRHVLALHGSTTLFGELHELSRTGGWDRMSARVDDDALTTFVAYGESPRRRSRRELRGRGAGADRIALQRRRRRRRAGDVV